jgi:leucyl aminopeptidase
VEIFQDLAGVSRPPVIVDVETMAPEAVEAELLAVPFTGAPSALVTRLDGALGGRLARLAADGEAKAEPGKSVVLHLGGDGSVGARRIALVGAGAAETLDEDAVRTAAASTVRAANALGGTVVWAFDEALPLEPAQQVRAVVEGALLGGYDPGRWKTGSDRPRAARLVIAGAPDGLGETAARAEVVARWTNRARELVDGPPNEVTPAGLANVAAELLDPVGVTVEALGSAEIDRLGLGGLSAVGRGSANEPRLIVLRSGSADRGAPLGLVGKSVTFDSGGFFLKPQGDIVKQKADMGGGAAVLGAIGAIAELGVQLDVLGVLPAAENMIGGSAFRPGDIVKTAAGLTVEITNPDAEGRLIMADALWFCRRERAQRIVDVATLTGAMRAALGDLYIGVFANDDDWRAEVVAAGDASGDHAWPWPLHRRYRRLLDSSLADLRNTSGRSFGYAIIAASFLERFVGDTPWAHLDIHSTAFLDEERDYLGRGASGAGVRLLTELAERLARVQPPS